MERTVYKNGKRMRYGITTGSCAAAAAKAATRMLVRQKRVEEVEIDTPKGWKVKVLVQHQSWDEKASRCAVKKDGGDDPDVTNGIEIFARAEWVPQPGIQLAGGEGVGRITRPGLGLPPGEWVINRVPREMIRQEVNEELPSNAGVRITLSIPKGEELAKRTFNPQLGIVGGLSIIGTSGIVEPMSEEAFKESLALDLEMNGRNQELLVFVPGNYGQDFCMRMGLPKERIFKTSNFIGYMLEQAMKHEIPKVLLVGHVGKFAKLAAGNFHTHNRVSDGRRETLTAYAAMAGVEAERLAVIFRAATTDAMIAELTEGERERIFAQMAKAIQERVERFVFEQVEVEVVLFSMEKGLLGQTGNAEKWLEDLRYEED